jgi:hypothetical protein
MRKKSNFRIKNEFKIYLQYSKMIYNRYSSNKYFYDKSFKYNNVIIIDTKNEVNKQQNKKVLITNI